MSERAHAVGAVGLGGLGGHDPVAGLRGEVPADRQTVRYHCARGHHHALSYAADARVPTTIDCRHCGAPAGLDAAHPPQPAVHRPYRTHLQYAQSRRSPEATEALLLEALDRLRADQAGRLIESS